MTEILVKFLVGISYIFEVVKGPFKCVEIFLHALLP